MSDIPTGLVPPHDTAAERAVLAACMLGAGALDEAAARLTHDDDWYHARHLAVWKAMLRLRAASKPVDLLTVRSELAPGELKQLEGDAGLAELAETMATSANVGAYAERVAELGAKRRLITAARQVMSLGWDRLPIGETLAQAEAKLFGALGRSPYRRSFADGIVADALEHLRRVERGEVPLGYMTGFRDLDDVTLGLKPGEYSAIGARTSMGKTTFALAVVARLCAAGVRCGIVSLEMDQRNLMLNLLTAQAAVDGHRLRSAQLMRDEAQRLWQASEEVTRWPLVIDDAPAAGVDAVVSRVRSMAVRGFAEREDDPARQGCDVVVLDYLQHVQIGDDRKRNEEIARCSSALKTVARETGAHVLAVLQLNRGVEGRAGRDPQLSDVRDSGQIEQDLDLAILLNRPSYYDADADPRLTVVRVAKNRNGPVGTVHLDFDRARMRFVDRTDPVEEPEERPRRRTRFGQGRPHPGVDE